MFKYTEKSDRLIRESSEFIRKLYEELFQSECFNLNLVGCEVDGLPTIHDFISAEDAQLQKLCQRNIQKSFVLLISKHSTVTLRLSLNQDSSTNQNSPLLALHDTFGKNFYLRVSPCDDMRCSCIKPLISGFPYTGSIDQFLILCRPSFSGEVEQNVFQEVTSVPSIESVSCIAAIKVTEWPEGAVESWRSRPRKWPAEGIVSRTGCQQLLAVLRGAVFKEKASSDDRFILDFSNSENVLIESLNVNARRLLLLCSSMQGEIFQFTECLRSASWFSRVLVLHSFFWMLERNGITEINTAEDAVKISQRFLEIVNEFLKSSFFPHYFLPHVNILSLANLPTECYTQSLEYNVHEDPVLKLSKNLMGLLSIDAELSDDMVRRMLLTHAENTIRLVVRQLVSGLYAVDSVDKSIQLHIDTLSWYKKKSSGEDSPFLQILYYLESSLGRLYCTKAAGLAGSKYELLSGNFYEIQTELRKNYTSKFLEIVCLSDLKSLTRDDCMKRALMHTWHATEITPYSLPCMANFIICCAACSLPKDVIANRLSEFFKNLGKGGDVTSSHFLRHLEDSKASGEYSLISTGECADRTTRVGNVDFVKEDNGDVTVEGSWKYVDFPSSTEASGETANTAGIPFSAQLSNLFRASLNNFDILFSHSDSNTLPSSLTSIPDLLCQDLGLSHRPLACLKSSFLCTFLFVDALAEGGQVHEALEVLENVREDLWKHPILGELEDRIWPVYFNATAEVYSKLGEKEKALELLKRSRDLFRSPRNRASWIMLRWNMKKWMRKGIGLSVIIGGVLVAILVYQW